LVLGSRNSGKTTFIRNAIGKEKSRTSTQVFIKDKYYRIQFIELLFDDVDFSSERRIEWPAYVNGLPLPEVDGVFCLYDVADKESVADVPAALSECRPRLRSSFLLSTATYALLSMPTHPR
jgi:GTPase SAR1 family protein